MNILVPHDAVKAKGTRSGLTDQKHEICEKMMMKRERGGVGLG